MMKQPELPDFIRDLEIVRSLSQLQATVDGNEDDADDDEIVLS